MSDGRRRIPLVDDEPSLVKAVGKRLEVAGFEGLIARDGEEAVAKAQAEHPDLIVLALVLPRLSGLEVCATLKKDQRCQDIPVVAVFSGKGEEGDEARCRQLNAAAYVTKVQGTRVRIEKIHALLGPGMSREQGLATSLESSDALGRRGGRPSPSASTWKYRVVGGARVLVGSSSNREGIVR